MKNEIKIKRQFGKDFLGKISRAKVTATIHLQMMEPKTVRAVRDLLTDHQKYRLNQAAGLFEIRYASEDADAVQNDLKRLYTAVNIFARASGCRVEYVDAQH